MVLSGFYPTGTNLGQTIVSAIDIYEPGLFLDSWFFPGAIAALLFDRQTLIHVALLYINIKSKIMKLFLFILSVLGCAAAIVWLCYGHTAESGMDLVLVIAMKAVILLMCVLGIYATSGCFKEIKRRVRYHSHSH